MEGREGKWDGKRREREDEMKGKINNFVKERGKRGEMTGEKRELGLEKVLLGESLQHLPPNLSLCLKC